MSSRAAPSCSGPVYYSLVVPIKDEEANIEELLAEIEPVMERLGRPWELICVDDGSTDGSLDLLRALCKRKTYLRVLSFTKNFGQSAAFAAGFAAACGELIITLDGDRQNDPADIPKLTAVMHECDLAVGWRVNRRDPLSKRFISRLSNWVRSRLCQDGMHDTGCSLKAYRRDSLKQITMYHGMHRFLPALFKIAGFRVKEIPVNHRERRKGATKYCLINRSIGPLVDMLAVRWMRSRTLRHVVREEVSHKQP